jgi:hypothetical protein
MDRFRTGGGSLARLQNTLRATCERFEPALTAHGNQALADFEQSVTRIVEDIVHGLELHAPPRDTGRHRVSGALDSGRDAIIGHSVQPIGEELSAAVTALLAGALAVITGAVSGGFGEGLGLAVISTLLGTSGPVGFLIGALIGLAAAAGGLWLGRDAMHEALRNVTIPGVVLRTVLRQAKYEKIIRDGREKTFQAVCTLIQAKVDPLLPDIAGEVLHGIKRLWA